CDDDPDEQLALIESDFSAGPKARFTMWIGSWEGAPFAYLQDCDTARHLQPFHADEPPGTRSIGFFIGPSDHLGQGRAAPLIGAFARHLAARGTRRVIADVVPSNTRSRAAFARAGFTTEGRRRDENGDPVLLFARHFFPSEISSGVREQTAPGLSPSETS
ncbi:MAG: GNAT family N-acetyltransferase, partial [Pseudomonadota bacterium]